MKKPTSTWGKIATKRQKIRLQNTKEDRGAIYLEFEKIILEPSNPAHSQVAGPM